MTERMILNTAALARHPWPEGVLVQGGDRGVVFADDGYYRTAFVEAFPAGTFLRGEGETIADAEDSCWQQYQRYVACDGSRPDTYAAHGPYERRQYRNGAGFCTRCGIWMSRVFEPLAPDPDRPRSRLERLFIDHDPEILAEVLTAVANADQLPGRPEDVTDTRGDQA